MTSKVPGRVLVVEDSPIIAMDVEDCLRQLGVGIVATAGDVAGALDSIGRDPPDLAILDYDLGGESSEAVADRLRELGIPFVLATGYAGLEAKLEDQGAQGLLRKPYGMAEIAAALEAAAGA